MKRTLSLILAVVMVALMIPFAAIIASATEITPADSPLVLDLPNGWVISKDDGVGTANKVDANGVTLGSDTQSIAMTEKVGVGQKRVITVDYGIPTKIKLMHFTWADVQPTAGNVPQNENEAASGGNDLLLCFFAGPDQNPRDNAAIGSWKASSGETSGTWLNAASNATGYYRTAADGEYTNAGTIRRWAIGNGYEGWIESANAIYDGALGTNGTKLTVYIEIDENDYITGAYAQFVLYDAEGNLVRENVIYTENDNAYKASCDGYFTIGHSGWGGNCAMTVKSVSINAGTAKEMGEVLHSTDFRSETTQEIEKAPSAVMTLPEGWAITTDDAAGVANKVDANGVTLGSDTQSISMTEKVGVGQARVITVDYGIVTAAGVLHFTWENEAGVVQSNSRTDKDLQVCLLQGPTSNRGDNAVTSVKISKDANGGYDWIGNNSLAYVEYSVKTTIDGTPTTGTCKRWEPMAKTDAELAIYDGANKGNGTKLVVYIDIDAENKITAVHQKYVYYNAEGEFVSEAVLTMPSTMGNIVNCDGYLTIGHSDGKMTAKGSGAAVAAVDAALNIKNVSINAGSYAAMGEVLHSTDFQAWGAENEQNAADYIDYMDRVVGTTALAKGEASYREDPNGIRFTNTFDAADAQLLVDLYEANAVSKVEFGTLITTKDWATKAEAVTFEALDAVKGDKTAYVEVMATVGDWYDTNTFAGTISTTNTEREYHAVGFIRITLATGAEVVIYSDVNTATLAGVQA